MLGYTEEDSKKQVSTIPWSYDAFLSFHATDESVVAPRFAQFEQAGRRVFRHQVVESISQQDYQVLLLKNLINSFNLDDLQTLCFELNIQFENLSGDTLNAKARGLIESMRKLGRLSDLAPKCTAHRNRLLWFDELDNFASDEQRLQALEESDVIGVVIGKVGLGSIQRELIRVAKQQDKRVIPVLLPDTERETQQRILVELGVVEPPVDLGDKDNSTAYPLLVFFPDTPEVSPEVVCPYLGLEAFKPSDARFFYGRQALIKRILGKIHTALESPEATRFMAIVGASGSGKSSLAQAGVLAQLQQERHTPIQPSEAHHEWQVVTCRPGFDPLESLAQALGTSRDGATFRKLIDDMGVSEEALHREVIFALQGTPQRRIAILVDQFEEVFTLSNEKGEARRMAFIRNLLYAARAPHGKTLVMITLRDDFVGACARYPDFRVAVSDHSEIVGEMSEAELRAAIESPAERCNVRLEPGLSDALLRDVQHQPGSLPFLGFALLELWNQRDKKNRLLTYASYESMGGVVGALKRRADKTFAKLGTHQELCQRIFLRLAQPSDEEGRPDTKRRATLSELLVHEHERDAVKRVVDTLIEARLVTTTVNSTNEQIVEVAHETLIAAWPRFQSWIAGARAVLRLRLRLRAAALEWARNRQHSDYLLRNKPLQDVARLGGAISLDALERRFLQVCIRRRNLGRVLIIASAGFIFVILVVVVARWLSPWQPVTGFERDIILSVDSIDPSGTKPSPIILVGTAHAGVVRNINNEATEWRTYSNGLHVGKAAGGVAGKGVIGIDRLAVDLSTSKAISKTIYAGVQRVGIYSSTDYGVNWHRTSLLTDTILVDMRANGPIVIAVSSRHNVFISTDSLASFTLQYSATLPAIPAAVGIDPSGKRVYIGTDKGIYSQAIAPTSTGSFGTTFSTTKSLSWTQEAQTPPITLMHPDAKGSGFYLTTYDPKDNTSALYFWQHASGVSKRTILPGKAISIAPNPAPSARFEVFALVARLTVLSYPLVTEVIAIEPSGAMTSLGIQAGYTFKLLAIHSLSSTIASPATQLLMSHCEWPAPATCSSSLMMYQSNLN